jgi:hypothetical protein
MDDRKRAIENDVRAKNSAPPAPDPTAIPGKGGFTGMEAIWNYFFWQTLSLNMVDSIGHILRLGVTASDCSPFTNEPPKTAQDQDRFKRCNSYLGPTQPGITNLPGIDGTDPLAGRSAGQTGASRARGRRRATRPRPGQRDVSKPQIALPPGIRELLGTLAPKQGRGRLPGVGRLPDVGPLPKVSPPLPSQGRGGAVPDQLLDFLLAP